MSSQLRVLCVLPEVPFPADSGGKQAMLNHMQLLHSTCECHFLILDADGNRHAQFEQLLQMGFSIEYFARQTPRLSNGLRGKFSAIYSLFFDRLPRTCSSRKSKFLEKRLLALIESRAFNIVVFEHISSYHFAFEIPRPSPIPFIYYSHNIESKSAYDKFYSSNSFGLKIALYIDFFKTRVHEKSILKHADHTISISDIDEVGS